MLDSVILHVQEDHMPSYFLAETCKYAFLTADSTFWKVGTLFSG